MSADASTRRALHSLNELRASLEGDNKVKVAGCVIMCMHSPILADLVTQVSMVGPDHIF